jgi:four helix bundle protein
MVSKVISFTDLDVYKRLYKSSLVVHKEIVPKLPDKEKYGLIDQLSRSTKSPCALIAEGYARRQTSKHWRKYIRDAIGECNETIVHLSYVRDLYSKFVDVNKCNKLIEEYDISARQLFRLSESWADKVD